ncbi:glycoside hydrolase family protein [Clostridium novyi]|uniref:glycoside hydrolase family protein n=1 Tax=Clostridium novyi TaxID=1542 RepID=UPI00069CE7F0|nr:SH3 domain-containing protein [Clostridium novyi]
MGLVTKECVDFVKKFEGFYSRPYYDIVGVKTLGYGMTGAEIQGLTYVTEAQASRMLEDLLNNKYALPIKRNLDSRGVRLKQNEFDALVSMAYNVGVGGVLGSTLYKDVCRGVRDKDIITRDFCMWCKAGGRTVNGLLRRRKEEAQMFLRSSSSSSTSNGDYGTVTATVLNVRNEPSTNANIIGKLNNGQQVHIFKDCGNGWYSIYFGEHGGYVSKKYIR